METIEHIVRHPTQRTRQTPLLFQHGAWHGAWCWQDWMEYFSALGYETHAISLPAHGNSSANKGHANLYNLNDYVDTLAGEVDKISPRPVVVGHSLGGAILQKYLENHQLPGAVLLASLPASGAFQMMLRLIRRHPLPILKGMLLLNLYEWVKTPELAQSLFLNTHTDLDVQAFHKQLVRESANPFPHILPIARVNPQPSPMLVISAEADAFFLVKEEEATARKYGAKHIMIEGQAHNLMMESAWRQVANSIEHWLVHELKVP